MLHRNLHGVCVVLTYEKPAPDFLQAQAPTLDRCPPDAPAAPERRSEGSSPSTAASSGSRMCCAAPALREDVMKTCVRMLVHQEPEVYAHELTSTVETSVDRSRSRLFCVTPSLQKQAHSSEFMIRAHNPKASRADSVAQ